MSKKRLYKKNIKTKKIKGGDETSFVNIAKSVNDSTKSVTNKASSDVDAVAKLGMDKVSSDVDAVAKLGMDKVSSDVDAVAKLGMDKVSSVEDAVAKLGMDKVSSDVDAVAKLGMDKVSTVEDAVAKSGMDKVSTVEDAVAKLGMDKVSSDVDALAKSGMDKVSESSSVVDALAKSGMDKVSESSSVVDALAKSEMDKVSSGVDAVAKNKLSKMIPGVAALGKLGDAYSSLKENIKKLKVPLTEEDKFNHALLKLQTNPQFSAYFTSTINNVLVLEFYKILTQLGQYSKKYSETVKKVAEKTGLKIVDEDDDFYSDIYSDSSVSRLKVPDGEKEEEDVEVFDNINIDRIIKKKNINKFLEDAMIINIPVIEEVFGKLNKIINEYKKLRGQANILIEKAEAENDAETYFEDFMHLSNKATEQIDAIFYEFDTGKKIGGAKADVRDDFNSSMLYMCNRGKKNLSKLLKLKLSGILNKIIVRLYDIANMKNVIDDEDEIEPRVLETKVEPDNFDIDAYEKRISKDETENLDIVKFQKIIVKIVKKMFYNILEKDDINLEPFKKIVIPAFKEKQKEFENLEKILEKDINEKKDLIKKNKKIGNLPDAETLEYMNYVNAEMKWTIINKNEINEYIKTEDEKEREKVKREKENKLEENRLKNMPDKVVKEGNAIEIDDPKKKIKIKVGDCIEYKKNKLSPLTTKKTVRSFDEHHNIKYRKGSDIKKVHLSDIWETIEVVECPKKGGNAITQKSSSQVSRKTRRHKRTSQ